MIWYNRTIGGYELECMMKVNTFLARIKRPLTNEEWTKILNDYIPGYLMASAIEYAMKEQLNKDNYPNIVVTKSETSAKGL